MSEAKRDGNFVTTALGTDGSGGTVPFTVDTATSRLLITVIPSTSTVPGTITTQRDENFVVPHLAVTDDVNQTVTPLIIDTSNGFLWADVVVE